MNFADIEKAWRSAGNRPSAAQLEKQKMDLINELHRRRRASRGLLVLTAIPLVLLTGRLLLHIVWPDPALDRLDLTREWVVVPFFLLPWAGWFLIWRQHRRHEAVHGAYAESIQASTAALLDENRRAGIRALVAAGGLLLSLPFLGGVVWQLRAVGKMGDEVLIPAFVIYPAYVVLMVAWIGWKHLRTTAPRRKELEARLSDYNRSA
ncbi:MAG: hypothetical protein QG602_3885 [Verrucomicrobiota bacterium]|nr:hypothetical protein [Verrucomicrobiota bacterium]